MSHPLDAVPAAYVAARATVSPDLPAAWADVPLSWQLILITMYYAGMHRALTRDHHRGGFDD